MQTDILWRRLDQPGHDGCRFGLEPGDRRIDGTALWRENGRLLRIAYLVTLGPDWSTRDATLAGWDGDRRLDIAIRRSEAGRWWLNDVPQPDLDALPDVDLGITPATNTNAIRRLNLGVGDRAQTTAAWLDPADWALKPLVQSYHRLAEGTYAYASPDHGYRAELTVDAQGIVRVYPGLWIAEAEDR